MHMRLSTFRRVLLLAVMVLLPAMALAQPPTAPPAAQAPAPAVQQVVQAAPAVQLVLQASVGHG